MNSDLFLHIGQFKYWKTQFVFDELGLFPELVYIEFGSTSGLPADESGSCLLMAFTMLRKVCLHLITVKKE